MIQSLPTELYRAAVVRELDRRAIEVQGIAGYTLMCRAGEAALRELRLHWPAARELLVLCGSGNNAGDGYVLARLARVAGMRVRVVALSAPERLRGDAALACKDFCSVGGEIEVWRENPVGRADVVVDAILGTGLGRELDGVLRDVVDTINAHTVPVLALDIPTGLHADSGQVLGNALRAALTVTFVALKIGLYTGAAREYVGTLRFDALGVAPPSDADLLPAARRINGGALKLALQPRQRNAHKGDHGHLLIVGGDRGMGGAAALAGLAALRSGAGRVTVATREVHAGALTAAIPELMCRAVADPGDLRELMEQADVIAVGPGLGMQRWGRELFAATLDSARPLVIDADGLNLLAQTPAARSDWVLTPHPGEAARLLGSDTAMIQRDRLEAVAGLQKRYSGTVVLKGAATLVSDADAIPWLCDRGNPGMAAPGMGDVLTGVIGSLVAQGLTRQIAAIAGVYVHALAGDAAAQAGERGLVARDVIAGLRAQLNGPLP